jgi:integrase
MKTQKIEWKQRWGHETTPSRYPNVYKVKEGGHLVRARVMDQTTGRLKEIKKVLPEATEAEAHEHLIAAKKAVQAGPKAAHLKTSFGAYALSVLNRKRARKELSKEKQDNWKYTLEHLIVGVAEYEKVKVNGVKDKRVKRVLVPGFGNHLVTQIRIKDIEDWKTGVSVLINEGRYVPSTANGWFTTFKTIMREAQHELEFGYDCFKKVKMFDESMHDPHPEEDPNALMEHQVPVFLGLMHRHYAHLYAMAVFGFVTGLRGTNISALRHRGDEADINWETGVCYVRRAAGRLGETRNTTKQKQRYRITLPPSLLAILRWHIETQIPKGLPHDSNYLFPSDKGEPRIAQVMNKPFADCSREMELPFDLSVSGMRRTYHDLAQAAGVKDLVVRSISGHQDAKMQARYTSFWGPRQLEALDAIMGLVTGKRRRVFIDAAEPEQLAEAAE